MSLGQFSFCIYGKELLIRIFFRGEYRPTNGIFENKSECRLNLK